MGYADSFPVDPDYSVTRSKAGNVLSGRVESARIYLRQKAAPQRVFDLVFTRRAVADWTSIENFRLAHMTDFFTFHDGTAARYFSCYFAGEAVYEEVGNEMVNIKCQLIEAIGAAMATYPSFAASNPYIRQDGGDPSLMVDLGADGKQFTYAGYGFRLTGTGTYQIFLDETDVSGSVTVVAGVSARLESVALGLHRVRVKTTSGALPTGLDCLI